VDTKIIVNHALRALLYEVTVNPKPGLVDPLSAGPHPDMNAFMFIDSALSLAPYFNACAAAGVAYTAVDLTGLFKQIRGIGVQAEQTMFAATKGVNTHKGAVFSLGGVLTGRASDSGGVSVAAPRRRLSNDCAHDAGGVNGK